MRQDKGEKIDDNDMDVGNFLRDIMSQEHVAFMDEVLVIV